MQKILIITSARKNRVEKLFDLYKNHDISILTTLNNRENYAEYKFINKIYLYCDNNFFINKKKIDKEIFNENFDEVVIPLSHSNYNNPDYFNVIFLAYFLNFKKIVYFYNNDLIIKNRKKTKKDLILDFLYKKYKLIKEKIFKLREISKYKKENFNIVLKKCQEAEEDGKKLWIKDNPKTDEEIKRFYEINDFYIYQLTKSNYYFGGRTEYLVDILPILKKKMKILNYGCGVGEIELVLAKKGYSVTLADLLTKTFEFVKWKFKNREIEALFINIINDKPLQIGYDVIICTDVLEHIKEPKKILLHLLSHINKGGYFITRIPYEEIGVPMHINEISQNEFEKIMRENSFKKLKTKTNIDIYIKMV